MLRRCIDSALAQTFPCEIVVCDHGSTDETPDVARSYGERIRYIRRNQDAGIHFSWLDGVVSARGEFVHLNFDDDLVLPTFIEKCMALMSPDVAFCFSVAEIRAEASGKPVSWLFREMGPTGVHAVSKFMNLQITSLVSPGATLIRRKDIIDQLFVGKVPMTRYGYRGVGPDWLMTAMTTLKYPRFGFVAEPLAIFTAHEGSITENARGDNERRRALDRAYQESRRYYAIAWAVRSLRLDLLARFFLLCMQTKAILANATARIFRSHSG